MLEAAISNGESGFDLSPCYISLAETYRDNKQFELAIKYYRKEYELTTCNSKEKIKTLLNIATCMEIANKDLMDIETIYDQAINQCIDIGDTNIQHRVLMQQIAMLRERGHLNRATELENTLKDIHFESQPDSEPLDEELTTNIGDDISIKDITDVSSDSDVDNNDINKPRTSRRKSKGFTIKRNPKGETQLHTACIAGNVELVRRLLEQGHAVNIRDNCGWLPIHEACICGHLEIVEMLIEKGAWINDKGGKLCDGITPLHDAASNGHLEIIQLLLDKGASAIAKTNSGVMPLQMLQTWRDTNNLDSDSCNLYAIVTSRLTQDVEKLGHGRNYITENKECSALVTEMTENSSVTSTQTTKKNILITRNRNLVGNLRRNISCDIDLDKNKNISDDSESSNDAVHINELLPLEERDHAKDEYRTAIQNLRHPIRDSHSERKRKSSENCRSALLEPGDVGDDWLENDMPVKHKKHKGTTAILRHSSGSLRRNSSSSSLKSNKTDSETLDEMFESNFNFNEEDFLPIDNHDIENIGKKRKIQTSLIDQGFTRQRSFSPTNNTFTNTHKNLSKRKQQTKITSFGESSITPSQSDFNISNNQHSINVFKPEPTLSIDVRIDGKLYRVPVLASELHFRTIRWLADEAADRYSRKECVKPTLELETKNGALLAEDDYLNIVFNVGMQAEEVEARIVRWNLPSLGERYLESCQSLGIETNSTISKILQDTATSLNLSGMGLGHSHIMPLCKSINRQINLQYLNLSDNFMRDSSFQLLCASLPSLDNLTVLNISNNELTSQGLKYFVDIFLQSTKTLLTNLISLDLSHNSLGDESLKSLAVITQYLKLQILDLVDVGFTNQVFDSLSNRNIDLSLDYLRTINISYNKLNKQQITKILLWINPQNCDELNISNNNVTEQGLLKDVVFWLKSRGTEDLKLKTLNLSRCGVTDMEVEELLRLMPSTHNLKHLNLSYNEQLTSNTLVPLLHQPLLVQLIGCEKVLNFTDIDTDNNCINIKELTISLSHTQYLQKNKLVDALKKVYCEKLNVFELSDYLKVSLLA